MDFSERIHRLRLWFREKLASNRASAFAVGLALVLTFPSIFSGLQLDDHGLAVSVGYGKPSWDLFNFIRPEDITEFKEIGFLGWWAATDLRVGFLRPITSWTHWVDFQWWPHAAWLMHLWNIIIYALLVGVAGLIFRRICPVAFAAGLAAVLFAIDDVHALTAGWIATRNALLATLFGFGALWAHDRWRRGNWRAGAVLAPLLFLVSLLCGEIGIACGGYLFAHAVCFEHGKVYRRLVRLIPYIPIVIGWRAAYQVLGYGAVGTGLYRDVTGDPLGFAGDAVRNACATVAAQLTLPLSTPLALVPGAWLLAAFLLAIVTWIIRPLLQRDPVARFFAVGTLAAALPFGATIPSDRLLLPLGLGASGLIAEVILAVKDGRLRGKGPRWVRRILVGLNVVLAILLFVPSLFLPMTLERQVRFLERAVPKQGDTIILNAPMELYLLYPPSIRTRRGEAWPEHVYPLFAGTGPIEIERTGDRILVIQPENGWLASPIDRITRGLDRLFRAGDRFVLEKMTVEVLDISSDGRPMEVRFVFETGLRNLSWIAWGTDGPAPWEPPAVGETVTVKSGRIF